MFWPAHARVHLCCSSHRSSGFRLRLPGTSSARSNRNPPELLGALHRRGESNLNCGLRRPCFGHDFAAWRAQRDERGTTVRERADIVTIAKHKLLLLVGFSCKMRNPTHNIPKSKLPQHSYYAALIWQIPTSEHAQKPNFCNGIMDLKGVRAGFTQSMAHEMIQSSSMAKAKRSQCANA